MKASSFSKQSIDDKIFTIVTYWLLIAFLILVAYPMYFVLVASFSDPVYINSGDILLYPKGFTTLGYSKVFSDDRIWTGYFNTIIYTVCGTILGVFCSLLAGYALSRKDLPGRNIIMGFMVFTMYFGGGTIPFYLLVKSMHLLNTRLILIIIGSISVYNIILIRTFFVNTLPIELQESAFIDGCGNTLFFFKIALPLSKAITAVIALYLAVGYWNSYFNAMIFITDAKKYPLQIFLREILLTANTDTSIVTTDPTAAQALAKMAEIIKYGVIVVTTVPIICIYPFIQKYFVKGVMIGSVKG